MKSYPVEPMGKPRLPQRILAIDPGPTESAWCVWDGQRLLGSGIQPNPEILFSIDEAPSSWADRLFIEEIASYGMAVGREVFRTCYWYGRFAEAWYRRGRGEAGLMERRSVKLHHCHSARATDANVRQALIDRFGKPGTKKAPGLLFGVKSHVWAALALATYAYDTLAEKEAA